MATKDYTSPHQTAINNLVDQGWMIRGFSAFIFMMEFSQRILEYCDDQPSSEDLARTLFADFRRRTLVTGKWRFAPTIAAIADSHGRKMTSNEVLARMRRYQEFDLVSPGFVPDAWRLSESPGVTLEVSEVSDTHPLSRSRLYRYSLLNDELPEAGINCIHLFEINAHSGAVTEHDLDSMLVDACRARAPSS